MKTVNSGLAALQGVGISDKMVAWDGVTVFGDGYTGTYTCIHDTK